MGIEAAAGADTTAYKRRRPSRPVDGGSANGELAQAVGPLLA